MSADNVLLEVLQRIDLTLNSGLVEHLRRLLERGGRNEARGLQCSTGDTLKYLIRRGGDDVTHLYGLQITTLERRVLVTQLAHRDDLPGLYVLRIACIHDNDLVVEFVVHIHELPLVHYLILEETRVSRILDLDLAHHLAYDHLEVLVVDLHTLHTVDLLHLVDDVLLHLRRAKDTQYVARGDGAVREGHTRLDVVVLLNHDLTRQGHQILHHVTLLRGDDDLAVTALDLAERYLAVDLRDDSRVRRVAGLEELRNSRQTSRDIAAGLAHGTRDLDQDISGLDLGVVLHHDVGRNGQVVGLDIFALLVDDTDDRVLRTVLRLDNHLLRQTRLFVALVTIRNAFDDAVVNDLTLALGDDNGVVGIPLADQIALLDLGAVGHVENRRVRQAVRIEYDLRFGIDYAELRLTRDDDIDRAAVRVLALDGAELVDLQTSLILRDDVGLDSGTAGNTSHVERTKRKLRTRLADRLRRDDTDDLTLLHHTCRGKVAAVALGADAVTRLARQYRTDLHRLQRRFLDGLGDALGDLLARLAHDLARDRVDHVIEGRAAQNAVVERLDNVIVTLDGRSRQTAQRAAILLVDDHVLRNIHQTTRQITRIGRLQCRIGQTLTGAVRRDEVLQHRKSLLEVRQNGVLDDLLTSLDTRLLRLGHKASHTRQLTDLLLRTTGSRVKHHVDGVEAVLILDQSVDHLFGEFVVYVGPDVDYLVVTLVVGDKTHVVVIHDGIGLGISLLDELLLRVGDHHSVEVERQTALEGHTVTHILDVVEEVGNLVGTRLLQHHGDDITQ